MDDLYILNQLNYSNLEYPTSLEKGKVPEKPYPTFAKAGCGLCCAAMLLSLFRGIRLTSEEIIDFSLRCGANENGTEMNRLGKALAEEYDLQFAVSSRQEDFLACLKEGGAVIFNSGAYRQIFSDNGHYLLAFRREADGRIAVLDPSLTKEKYTSGERAKKVEVREGILLVGIETVAEDCSNRKPAYYLFRDKKAVTQSL